MNNYPSEEQAPAMKDAFSDPTWERRFVRLLAELQEELCLKYGATARPVAWLVSDLERLDSSIKYLSEVADELKSLNFRDCCRPEGAAELTVFDKQSVKLLNDWILGLSERVMRITADDADDSGGQSPSLSTKMPVEEKKKTGDSEKADAMDSESVQGYSDRLRAVLAALRKKRERRKQKTRGKEKV